MMFWVFKAVLTPILVVLYRVRVRGARKIPLRGAAIIAANHNSFCDSLFLPLVLPRKLTFVAKAEYFDSWKTAWFFRSAGQIPIRRGDGQATSWALETAKDVIRKGKLFGIYPEGTRSVDGRLYKGRTGVARLAIECQVPVFATAIIGTREVQPKGAKMWNILKPVEVRFSEPLNFSDRFLPSDAADPEVLRMVTDEIMAKIAELSGQEYVNEYSDRRSRYHADRRSDPSMERRTHPAGRGRAVESRLHLVTDGETTTSNDSPAA